MQKVVIHKPGGYERLEIETHPDLKPKSGEVVVTTAAVGVNYADCCVRWGVYQSAKDYVGWPITPGFEFSGTVTEIGADVKNVKPGDRVFGITRFGGYASQVLVPAHQVFPMPKTFSFSEAAAFPAVFMTAYHALFQNVRLRPGHTLLVHSAAGGVGTALLQLGKLAECKVIGVVGSPHKVEVAKHFGADIVIDKSSQDLWKEAEKAVPGGYDLILDANGHPTLMDGYRHLRPTGRLVTYGYHTMLPKSGGRINYLKAAWGLVNLPRFSAIKLCDENKGVFGFNISFLFDRLDLVSEGMTELLKWANAGKIMAPKVTEFKFAEVAEAHKKIESATSVGKLVLVL